MALLIGFAMLCFGMVTGAGAAQAAGTHTVSGTIQFPASAPSSLKVPWQPDGTGTGGYVGVYLTLDVKQDGPVEGWQLGQDANVSFDPATGAWAVTDVPEGVYRLTINVSLPGNGSAPGTHQELTVDGDEAVGTTVITEEGRLRASIARCGWVNGDETAFYAKNVATGTVYEAESAQSGWTEPSTACPPEVSYGNYGFSGLPAGDYIAYSVWNGNTQYYTGLDAPTAAAESGALQFAVENWAGTGIQTLVFAPVASATPTISGTAKVGATLTASPGSWGPAPVALSYQWLRNGSAISGATSVGYTAVPADAGKTLSVRVTGTKTGYATVTKTSAATAAVAAGTLTAATPTISGTARPGETLTASPGTWGPAPVSLSYQWLRNGVAIDGATAASYTPEGADIGRTLSVAVTGTKTGYASATRTSAETASVALASAPFIDVPEGHQFYTEISWMYGSGLSTGSASADGRIYRPKAGVTREAMAAFLYRLEGADFQGPATSPFVDVQPDDRFYDEIAWMYEQGLSTGTNTSAGRVYEPTDTVSRAAMAAFLYRLKQADTTGPATSYFADVQPGHKFYDEISWMYETGLSTGTQQPTGLPKYLASSDVSRQAMAAFLFRIEAP
ncbi:S-layer homology domain-containing protein [Leucobacter allii]|uniref:S-layer homology domain-containing protein n=1 Tax=Leucobacter allii TaxID=2932247 RepID=UPI001FD37DD7|nr:S-layer homology domain-containing protein [Leucobacter allii]UOR01471.1 S-layer homology domain-containing protein [Leucobacter allii]